MGERRHIGPRATLFPLFLVALAAVAWAFRAPLAAVFSSADAIRSAVARAGAWGPLLFVLLQVLQVLLFFIPGELVQIAGGWLFGVLLGTLLSVVGIGLGSLAVFSVSRLLGAGFVSALLGAARTERLGALMRTPRASAALFALFLIPGVPKDLLCFVAGLSKLRLGVFLGVSLAARLPGILGSSLMGAAVAAGKTSLVVLIFLLAAALAVLGVAFRDRLYLFLSRATPGRGRKAA